jgi:hypothetical protein
MSVATDPSGSPAPPGSTAERLCGSRNSGKQSRESAAGGGEHDAHSAAMHIKVMVARVKDKS